MLDWLYAPTAYGSMIRRRSDVGSSSFGCDRETAPSMRNLNSVVTSRNNGIGQRHQCHYCRLFVSCFFLSQTLTAAYVIPPPPTKATTKGTSSSSSTISIISPQPTSRLTTSLSTALSESSDTSTTGLTNNLKENNDGSEQAPPPSSVEHLLRMYQYGGRIIKLDFDNSDGHLIGQRVVRNNGKENEEFFVLQSEGEIFAEVQEGGNSRICRIVGLAKASEKSKKKKAAKVKEASGNSIRPPRLEVAFVSDDKNDKANTDSVATTKTIDIGQITTVWASSNGKDLIEAPSTQSSSTTEIWDKVVQILPVNHVDDAFENRYKFHVGRGRNIHGGGALTKKQVEMISAAASVAASSSESTFEQTEELRRTIDLILKQCIRCGSKYTRLLDSEALEEWMFYDEVEGTVTHDYTSGSDTTLYERRIFCATALAKDTKIGGRFKRMPCMWLPPPMKESDDETGSPTPSSTSTTLTLVNGAWLVVDQSVRAASEGRKFAESALKAGGKFTNDSNNERILCRLESLACGEKLKQQKRGGGEGFRLEVDVRTTLEAMDLPLSSEGAQEALIRMGRWTKKEAKTGDRKGEMQYERWSPSVLEAAEWYVQMDRIRRRNMKSKILESRKQRQNKQKRHEKSAALLEGRVDLTDLPCICVDSQRTSFRDDAFGIRKRSSTGRKVNKKASQWELLFHITDVSDIYSPNPMVVGSPCASIAETSVEEQKKHLKELESAAMSRIRSEYDLPLGPLHLLPTTVLTSLSLDVFKQDWTSDSSTWPTSWHTIDKDNGTVNRAVTLWVYIDERSGRVVDSGLERSIISRPLALTFETATKILDASDQQQDKFPPILAKARVLLSVVERNIKIWSEARKKKSDLARAREEKMVAREMIANQVFGGRNNRRKRQDDGKGGDFRQTRGHQLVDSTLYLYEFAFRTMIKRRNILVPQHPTSSGRNKDYVMRSATAPLRVYLQGLAQRQALSAICDYGGSPIANEDCKKIGSTVTSAFNVRRNSGGATNGPRVASPQQLAAVRSLNSHLCKHRSSENRVVPAISTGSYSEVVIQGVGAVALCKGIPGTIKPGVKVMVRILNVDTQNGKVVVALDSKT